MTKYIFFLVYVSLMQPALAQVVTKQIESNEIKYLSRVTKELDIPKKQLSAVDTNQLLKEDEDDSSGLPPRFGKDLDVNYDLKNSGLWTDDISGKIWTLIIESKNAYSLNFIFDRFRLAEGAQLLIYNADSTMMMGPFTSEMNNSRNSLATDIIQGSSVILELYEPNSAREPSDLHISKAIHGYKNVFKNDKNFGDAGSCHNNIRYAGCPVGED